MEERVLILAPRGRDAQVIGRLVSEIGCTPQICGNIDHLTEQLARGAGTALVAEEALLSASLRGFFDWLREQGAWSDFPFILLATRQLSPRSPIAQAVVRDLGNVVVLERPISAETLASAVDSALRARRRQYQTRDHLHERERSEERLETRIALRTRDLARANDRLVKEIAERERAQAALVQAQKMEAVGQLTNGIAHDFNNLLTAIVGNVDLIARRSTDERVKRLAGYAMEAADRASRLTGQLLAFSRTQKLDLRPVAVDELIAGMGDLLRRSIGPSIEITTQLTCSATRAVADANQLELAILNLAINARDAMPAGGRLVIATAQRETADADLTPGAYVVISIADNGSGIPPHLQQKVFEPFFTTKPMGKGTGLGLSQVYGIAHQSGGTARLTSTLGKGTTVELLLPVSHAVPESVDHYAHHDSLADIAQGESVLVVEDDRDVRRLMVECLRNFGYRVSEAHDGQSGLEALQQYPPDVLIVDFAMPGVNGAELATAARSLHGQLPIVFVTGYADMDAVERVNGTKFLLRKPFEVAALANIVRDALEQKVDMLPSTHGSGTSAIRSGA